MNIIRFGLSFLIAVFSQYGLAKSKNFEFVTLGDTAYKEDRYPEYEALIKKINKSKPAFTIHVGDTIGYRPCTDEVYQDILGFFNQYKQPLIYTPGDNEWTDCVEMVHYKKNGFKGDYQSEYRLNRLNELRKTFFPNDESLGKKKIKLIQQSDISEYKETKENRYWLHNDVLFATVHVTGSSDGFSPWSIPMASESIDRRKAANAWLKKMAEIAKEKKVKAVVIATHAELFDTKPTTYNKHDFAAYQSRGGRFSPYVSIGKNIARLAKASDVPLLLIHGDFHRFVIDRPFYMSGSEDDPKSSRYDKVTRLQVFGAPEIKAVKVKVEPDTPWVFSFSPLY